MSTFMANEKTIERRWFVIDAAGKPLGRTAVRAADILRGKHRPEFTPHADCGEYVIIVNADKAILTGKKLEKKFKRHHTLYMGGMKEVQYSKYMAEKSDEAVYEAVKGMLPKNRLGRQMIKKLRVYKDDKHEHAAQKPEVLQLQKKRYN